MSGRDDNPFNVKLGRIFTPDGTGRFLSLAGRVRRAAKSSGARGGGRSRRRSSSEQLFMRRVIVKVNLVRMGGKGQGAQRLHLDYIQRDGAGRENEHENEKGVLYDKDGMFTDADNFHEDGKNDRHQFRIIVSPEDSKDMCNLTAFTRDFMNHMEADLETRLEWVAADHYDTAIPHTHVVLRGVRDDGKDLVIPRKYISYGMRDLAADLVTRELGHIRQMDAAKKIAMMVPQERFTGIDRSFVHMARAGVLDMTAGPQDGSEAIWRLNMGRLKRLGKMGLVEKMGWRTWKLDAHFERTLRRLGERGDILKTYHRAMTEAKLEREVISDEIYDAFDEKAKPVTGKVIEAGIIDDVNDRAYVVLDTMSGEALYVAVGKSDNIEDIKQGMVVEARPASIMPKPSDYTIDAIADKRRGIYSPAAHMTEDKTARPEFIEAHVRRLEAMRRAGHAERNSDGSWKIPHDYLKRAVQFEKSKAYGKPVDLRVLAREPLEKLAQTMGRTWLDEELFHNPDNGEGSNEAEGFGEDVTSAKNLRRKYLLDQAIITRLDEPLQQSHLDTLEARNLKQAAKAIAQDLSKPYITQPNKGRITGTYLKSIIRPSGRYAVIERAKDFTLVPWRDTLERNLGREVSGSISRDGISWALTKGREVS